MNILFTCAGRRNYLINYFKESLNGEGLVLAADNQLTAPALIDADISLQVPTIYSNDYITNLKKIITEHHVEAIISLNDLELPILSDHKEELEQLGAKVIVSDPAAIKIAFDKWETYKFFRKIGVNTPETFLNLSDALDALKNDTLSFPLVVKPRWGSASIGIDIVENENELTLAYQLQCIRVQKSILNKASSEDIDNSILIQEVIAGEEYGIDILNNFDGDFYGAFVRKKLRMRSGETDKAISVIDERFTKMAQVIAENTRHVGNMDCDFFVRDEEIYFLEMNPRFGGGYPFSHEAGINTPSIYIDWLRGITDIEKHNNFTGGMAFSKCDRILQIPNDVLDC